MSVNEEKISAIRKWVAQEGSERIWGRDIFFVDKMFSQAKASMKDDPDVLSIQKASIEKQIASLQSSLTTIDEKLTNIKPGGLSEAINP